MALGPNFAGLDKGFKVTDSTAYAIGEAVKLDTPAQSCKHIGAAAAATDVVGFCQEAVDAAKVATGKVFINARLFGLSKAIAGASITKGARLTTNASNQVVVQATAGGPVVAIAMETQTTVGGLVDVFVIPGLTL